MSILGDDIGDSGEWYQQPTEQRQEQDAEHTKLQLAKPLVQDVVKRLDERIAFYNTIDSVDTDLSFDPIVIQQQLAANKLVRDILTSERDYILALLSR